MRSLSISKGTGRWVDSDSANMLVRLEVESLSTNIQNMTIGSQRHLKRILITWVRIEYVSCTATDLFSTGICFGRKYRSIQRYVFPGLLDICGTQQRSTAIPKSSKSAYLSKKCGKAYVDILQSSTRPPARCHVSSSHQVSLWSNECKRVHHEQIL